MILTTIALVAQATPAPSPAASPAASPSAASSDADKKIDDTAKAWFVSLQHGNVLDASALDAQVSALLTPAMLKNFAAQFGPLGDPTGFSRSNNGMMQGNAYYIYVMTFKGGATWRWLIAFDGENKISGMQVLPQQ